MKEDVALSMQLYYENDQMEKVTVAEKLIRHSLDTFPTTTHFVDHTLTTSPILSTDPWVGKPIGIRFTSMVAPELAGGFWDLDNIRLEGMMSTRLEQPVWMAGQFSFTIVSEPGLSVDILQSKSISFPLSQWSLVDTVENESGSRSYSAPILAGPPNIPPSSKGSPTFYMVRQTGL